MKKIIMKYGKKQKDGLKKPSKDVLSESYVKYYEELLANFNKLNGMEHALFHWLAERMKPDNIIYINKREIALFSEKHGHAEQTIKAAYSALKKKGFLIEHSRGVAWVNPLYAFRGSEEERVPVIQEAFSRIYDNLVVTLEKDDK